MTRLLLLRHGRTAWNHTGRAQGHADVPLDEVGEAQAARAARLVAAMNPVRLWSSDLARARQTAAAVAAATGLEPALDARLREFAVGERQGLTHAESVARFPHLAEPGAAAHPLRGIPGAEDDEAVRARIVPALEECLAELAPGEVGVVVTHGAALRLALAGVLGWPDDLVRSLGVLDNCHWATVEVTPAEGRRRLAAYGVGDFASTGVVG